MIRQVRVLGASHALGNVPGAVPGPVLVTQHQLHQQRRRRTRRHLLAIETLVTGLLAATSLVLFAAGKPKPGYVLGMSSALWGAVSGAIRIYSTED